MPKLHLVSGSVRLDSGRMCDFEAITFFAVPLCFTCVNSLCFTVATSLDH